MEDNFSAGDRQTLIELRIDMRYTREAMERLSNEHAAASDAVAREFKEVWGVLEDYRQFKWRLAGGIAVANVVLAAVARIVFK